MNEKERYVLEHYKIYQDGRVFSQMTNKFLKFRTDKDGYFDVSLVYNSEGNRMPFRVHRLVALKYLEKPENYNVVNHKDLNKQNNNVDNLEWCTHQQNMMSGSCRERSSETQRKTHPNRKAVICIETQQIYSSMKEAQRETGISNTCISECCNHKRLTAGGFHWEFYNN